MSPKTLSRRDFLKTTWIILGSAALASCGLAPENALQPTVMLPEYTLGGKEMSNKILVAYASQGGSTADVAEAIGKTLANGNDQVDVRPVSAVTDLSPYQAVVVGSAVHSGKWMPEALEFVERNQEALRRMPTAIFQVCMMMATNNEEYRSMVPEWLAPLRTQVRPVAEGSFAGAIDPAKYPKLTDKLGLRIFLKFIKMQPGDYRNWDAIRAWADNIRPALAY